LRIVLYLVSINCRIVDTDEREIFAYFIFNAKVSRAVTDGNSNVYRSNYVRAMV